MGSDAGKASEWTPSRIAMQSIGSLCTLRPQPRQIERITTSRASFHLSASSRKPLSPEGVYGAAGQLFSDGCLCKPPRGATGIQPIALPHDTALQQSDCFL